MSHRFPIDNDKPMPPPDKGGRPPVVRKIAAKYAADLAAGKYASVDEAAAAYMAEHKPQISATREADAANYRAHMSRFIELMSQ
ncbi:hypothetical protein ACW7G2_03250 [Luteimonas sp. A277]